MATKYIQAPEAFVVTGIGTTETQITLSNFKTISGNLINQSMLGGVSDYIPMTLSPRTEREEQVLAKVNSVLGDNVILDIIRAVNPVSPYNNGGGVAQAHNVNDTAVISNNPALFNKLTAKDNDETVTANWTFDGDNTHNGEETFTDTVDVTSGLLKVAPAVANDEPYTKLQSDTALALKANANATVNLTGNQTVAGVKTFSSSPVVPTAFNPTDAINKSQVEAYIAPLSGDILASDTAFGTVKLDTAADVPADPKALTATEDRVEAMSGGGDFGTPSASNKFVTEEYLPTIFIAPQVVVFTSSGTWTKDAGLKYIVVEGVGGGGGSGVTNGAAGGGGYFRKLISVSALGATETVTVGAGGNSNTTDGGNTSFGSHATADGGRAGDSLAGSSFDRQGGTATGGDINITGGIGRVGSSGTGGNYPLPGGSILSNNDSLSGYGVGGTSFENGAPGIVIVTEYYS